MGQHLFFIFNSLSTHFGYDFLLTSAFFGGRQRIFTMTSLLKQPYFGQKWIKCVHFFSFISNLNYLSNGISQLFVRIIGEILDFGHLSELATCHLLIPTFQKKIINKCRSINFRKSHWKPNRHYLPFKYYQKKSDRGGHICPPRQNRVNR